ncbi:hypothetical protein Tco_1361195 [Tanacetum coccineum]
MSKSKILGVNVDSDKVKGVASKLGCLILKTSFTYLGSKVGGSMSRVHAWNEVETSRHLFFSCCMVRQIVRKITRWWDVPYVEVESYEDWYNWLVNLRISSMHKQMFEGVFYVMWWHLWSFRNKLIFYSKPPSHALFFDDVVIDVFSLV